MKFTHLAKNGPVILTPQVFNDNRGFFMETFRQNDFERECGNHIFVQDNHSCSTANVLRGLHYQLKHPQGKLIRVILGSVLDVAVDLRKSSSNFGKSYTVTISHENKKIFWIPPGFAHGFLVQSEIAEFVYKCTDYYDPSDEYCLLYNDPILKIDWNIDLNMVITSSKDALGKTFNDCEKFD